jgi:hypothetical protein
MLKYRRIPFKDGDYESASAAMGDAGSMAFTELSSRSGVRMKVLCRLILEGKLFVDWFTPIGAEPVVGTAPVGQQVWPAPGAKLPNCSLNDDEMEDCESPAVDEHAVALAWAAIGRMAVHPDRSEPADTYSWWQSRTRRTFEAQCRA